MKLLWRIATIFPGNVVGLVAAAYFLPDFQVNLNLNNLAFAAGLLTLGNIFVKPALKTILAPLVWLTLGLFTIVINAGVLTLVDFFTTDITINGLVALLYGTLIISAANLVVGMSVKSFIKENVVQQPII